MRGTDGANTSGTRRGRRGDAGRGTTTSRRSLLFLLVAVVAPLGVVAAQQPSSVEVRYRTMPLGDSVTAGPGCRRALLWNRLQQAGHVNVDFVGSRTGGGCSVPHDDDHEGHSGHSATGALPRGSDVDRRSRRRAGSGLGRRPYCATADANRRRSCRW
ncbi:hypothetical protein GCM10018963_57690 [Saccharothrix longispora]